MDELLAKKVPHAADAEQAVIGSMLISPKCVPDVIERLRADDFYIKVNHDIFDIIHIMFEFGKTIDVVTVLDMMKEKGVYNEKSEQYMMEVMRMTPSAANVLEYAAIVRDKALVRRLGEVADNINAAIYEGSGKADELLSVAEKQVYDLRQGREIGGLISISRVVQNVFDDLTNAAASGSRIPGIATGLVDLDRMTLGLNKTELILIAARPGMGKTSIALNMALYAALHEKKTVAMFSLEMSREQLVMRLLSREAMVPSQNLLTGRLSEPQWREISSAAQRLSLSNILIDDNPMLSVSDMLAQCRRIENLDLVVIDYLQLMQSSGSGKSWANESRTQAVSDISRMLKIMAKDLKVPVVCLSQLSRANESRTDKRPILSDLRESGAIEQDADVVIALYRDGYYNKDIENPNLAEAIILKNRKGSTGTVELTWVPEYTSFVSLEKERPDEY